jgi:hypothetical protein
MLITLCFTMDSLIMADLKIECSSAESSDSLHQIIKQSKISNHYKPKLIFYAGIYPIIK